MEELLNYLKEFLFKIFKNKLVAKIIHIAILLAISFKGFLFNGFDILSSNNILNFYNLPEEIVGTKYTEFWQLLFGVLLIIGMILYPKIFLKKQLILKIIFEIIFSLYNTIIIYLIIGKLSEENTYFIKISSNYFIIIFSITYFLVLITVIDFNELYDWKEINKIKLIRKIEKLFNQKIEDIMVYLCVIVGIVIIALFFFTKVAIYFYIFVLFILLKIFFNYKFKRKIILMTRFFKFFNTSVLLILFIQILFSILGKGPKDKRRYLYLEKEKGIINVVVYQKEENYIMQNAKIIENYNEKILILDTRSFYIINKEGIYNEEIKVENFNNIIRGAVINDDEAKIILEKLQDNNSLNELKKMLEVFIGKIYIKK